MLIFNTNKIDKPEAIKELRRALGAGAMGSALPSDEEILTLAEAFINDWDQNISDRKSVV